jgi:diguanylate cyclase (GGDEF)-like protein
VIGPRSIKLPSTPFARFRLLFLVLAVISAVLAAASIAFSEGEAPVRFGGTLLSLGLAAYWVRGYRRGRFSLVLEPLEAYAIFLVLYVAPGEPFLPLLGLIYRSLYGGVFRAFGRYALWMAALLGAHLDRGEEHFNADLARAMGSALAPVLGQALLAALHNSEIIQRRLTSIVQNSTDVVTIVGADLRVRWQAASIRGVLAHEPGAIVGALVHDLVHPDDRAALDGYFAEADGRPDHARNLTLRLAHGNGGHRHFDVVAANRLHDPSVGGYVLNMRDATDRRELESELRSLAAQREHDAMHDPLTGLANRRCFIERLDESLRENGRTGERLAVLFIDLDQFKQVNDSLGHGVGDELLVSVAARLSEHVRLIDMLARLGGDEFICLMEAVRSEAEVEMLAREILGAFELPFKLGDHELFLTAAVGISLFPGDGDSVLDLMRNADSAMYRAKAQGRGNFHFYTPEMTRDAQERIRMETLLRRALDKGELAVHLQPQIETQTGRLVGAEALVRWNSPELGQVMPMRFIPLAEDSGLIIGLGNWVLRETCRQFMQWRLSGFELAQVSVNLSVKQLERPEFIDVLENILDETGMDPAHLKLELTESVVMGVGDAFTLLERLRDLGISLALDDFGTGYSSLSYLKMLPVQQLKIDASFVEGIGRNTGDEAIIRTVMELARSLGFEVVAEGVETEAQAAFLAQLGCEQLQGHLHGRAVAPAEFRARWSIRP